MSLLESDASQWFVKATGSVLTGDLGFLSATPGDGSSSEDGREDPHVRTKRNR